MHRRAAATGCALLLEDTEQCLLYLHRGGYRICLLVNFGEKPIGRARYVNTPRTDFQH